MKHLVTGAGSGIGAAIAQALDQRGDTLLLVARSAVRAAELARTFPRAECLVADLEDPAQLGDLDLPEQLDSVVHAAGVVELARLADLDHAGLQRQLAVNLTAPTLLTAACLPALRAASGTVVFINSTAGLAANAGWGAYAAGKFGLRAIADSLRAEEQAFGVRVSTVFPGRTATPMQEQVHAMEGRDYDPNTWIQPRTVATRVLDLIDLPRDATVPELVIRPN